MSKARKPAAAPPTSIKPSGEVSPRELALLRALARLLARQGAREVVEAGVPDDPSGDGPPINEPESAL